MDSEFSEKKPALPLLEEFLTTRVGLVCICAGSRNTPLILMASKLPKFIPVRRFVDERSAAFFALGFSKSLKESNKCAVVITTSGTAVAELLPAMVEAYYSRLPLVALTADRPSRFRGSGAPQCIEQVHILGQYAEKFQDFSTLVSPAKLRDLRKVLFETDFRKERMHLNICFDENDLLLNPLPSSKQNDGFLGNENVEICVTQDVEESFLVNLRKLSKPLVLMGPSAVPAGSKAREVFFNFLKKLNAPIRAEPQSADLMEVSSLLLSSGDSFIKKIPFESVIRLGGVPTGRFWRDLESAAGESVPVVSLDEKPFAGLSQGRSQHFSISNSTDFWERFRNSELKLRKYWDEISWADLRKFDLQVSSSIKKLLKKYPNSEVALLNSLLEAVYSSCPHIFLGNSLAIREWDLVEGLHPRVQKFVESNRGANGIDGELSSFLGWMESASKPRMGLCLLGDLTTLYDLNAPWIIDQMSIKTPMTLVVLNNSGGKIFSRLKNLAKLPKKMREEFWELKHGLSFQSWAKFWNLSHKSLSHGSDISPRLFKNIPRQSKLRILELTPDAVQSNRFWADFDRIQK